MVTNSASLGRYDDVKLQMPMQVTRADKVIELGGGDWLFDRAYVSYGVKTGKAHDEQMFSAMHPKAEVKKVTGITPPMRG